MKSKNDEHIMHGVTGFMSTIPRQGSDVLLDRQVWESAARGIPSVQENAKIRVKVRYDDDCKNQHNSFAITATVWDRHGEPTLNSNRGFIMGGCCHAQITKAFPELAHLIPWHGMSSDSPIHYIANTLYHAGNRDFNGLLKDEFRQHFSRGAYQADGVEGIPHWKIDFPEDFIKDIYANEMPKPITLHWKPSGQTGIGKERDFEAARESAKWPEATDEELSLPKDELRAKLEARVPALLAEFNEMLEKAGLQH